MAKVIDDRGSEIFEGGHGKKPNQKLKPYVVLQYLLKRSDEIHAVSAAEIIGYLEECGICAERRSIYRDIDDINKVMWMVENDTDIHEAEEVLAADEDDVEKIIVYDKSKKGFYVRQRHFDLNDIRLLAECVYSAKFVAEGQAQRLVEVVSEFVSEEQAKKIRHNAFLTDRVKTNNKATLNSIATINEAMSKTLDGQPHTPQKISFKYLKYTIDDLSQQVERRKGAKYTVSPYQLLINDGNYYLLAFEDKAQDMRTYRIDRMKDVQSLQEPREGAEAFAAIDLKTYTQRVFSMFGGEQERVTMRFINPLLDTVVDRFGTKGVQYAKVDERHFKVTAQVEISDQFFAWVCGFGTRAKIISPSEISEKMLKFLLEIKAKYLQ